MKKLAIVTTHPIQYNAPVFEMLQQRGVVECKVFYTWGESAIQKKFDPGFGKVISWDIPLLNGYPYQFAKNTSSNPGSHHFFGIVTPTLNKEIEQWGADVVLVYGWSFLSHLRCMIHFKNKIPIYFRGDSTLLNAKSSFIKKIFRRLLLSWVYRFIDKAMYVGTENKKYYQAAGVSANNLVFVPHAIDNSRFKLSMNNTFRVRYDIPSDVILFLFAGKLEKIKNVDLLIESFTLLKNQNAYLLIIGNGPEENNIKNKISLLENQFKSRIRVGDFVNQKEMPDVYHASDVFVLPSISETWGLSVNEAMAAGKAVIVSDTCGCAIDLVEDGVNGYIFKSENKQSLADKMNLLDHKNRIVSMGLASKVKISSWSFESVVSHIENEIR